MPPLFVGDDTLMNAIEDGKFACARLFRAIWGFGLDVAHILGQVRLPKHLPDGLYFSGVIPIMVRDSPQRRAIALTDSSALVQ